MAKASPLSKRKMSTPCKVCKGKGNGSLLTLCVACYGSGCETITCRQCWNKKEPWRFRTSRGKFGGTCSACRERNRTGVKKPPRHGLPDKGQLRVKLNVVSSNIKTGPIPVSMSSSPTCPPSCAHRNGACYAETHFVGMHWRRLSSGGEGITWDEFCKFIDGLPEGQVWRHNEAGDLPGTGEMIDVVLLEQLVEANRGKAGFTYTHKEVFDDDGLAVSNRRAIYEANQNGFTVNLSADSLEHADALLDLSIGPVAVTLPDYAPKKFETPKGRKGIVCPAQVRDDVTCASCGLCAKWPRRVIIGFWAHGPGKNKVESSFQLPLFRAMTEVRRAR